MRTPKILRPAIGALLCLVGFAVARITPYREGTVMLEAGGCRMVTDIMDKGNNEVAGSVILLHGLAANKKLMAYMARSFAEQNLRVFVPDLPGHGRTQGPFSFSRAETCAESFTRQLIGRRAIDTSRTILAGHSMGGAIALRLGARIPVAGVVAVSPAPMSTRHGIAQYLLPFENAPPAPAKTLVISGSWEPAAVRETANELMEGPNEAANRYVVIPRATHVSLIFSPAAARAWQDWAANALGLTGNARPPSLLPLAGSLAGFVGILLLAGPFLRETLGVRTTADLSHNRSMDNSEKGRRATQTPPCATGSVPTQVPPESSESHVEASYLGLRLSRLVRPLLETGVASIVAVVVAPFWEQVTFVRLFDGGYFASFVFVVGLVLLAMRSKSLRALMQAKWTRLLSAAFAALLLHFLVTVWFDATITEAWLTWFRWVRFPILVIAFLPYLLAEELLSAARLEESAVGRIIAAIALRGVAWLALLVAIFVVHNGPILLLLLAPYFALFCILQLAGMQLVRRETRSPAAAALFGAILLAGFCLVIFPVT